MRLVPGSCTEETLAIFNEVSQVIDRAEVGTCTILSSIKMDADGYVIEVRGSEIMISYHDRTDFCRALMQVCSADRPQNQKDQRIWKEFGIMVDISRNAVLNAQTVRKLIRMTALMGYNFLGLYMEDTIKIKEEPYFGYMRGALSQSEILEADQYAAIFGIELRPYIQTLAHLNQITRYENYQSCIDINDILLIGDERTYQFLEHLIKTVSEGFSTRKINIGMDEAHLVGLGKYLDQHGYETRFKIMEQHLERVVSICRKYGMTIQMWSDMFFRLAFGGEYYVSPEAELPDIKIPEGIELVYWDYYSCDRAKYEDMLRLHLRLSDQVGFAGGAWKWTGFAPHNRYSIEAGNAALGACRNNAVQSVVITAWGDNGAEAGVFSILPTLYADADHAYTNSLPASGFQILTGITFEDFQLLDDSNLSVPNLEFRANSGKYLLYNDPLIGTFDSMCNESISSYYAEAQNKLEVHADAEEFGYLFKTQSWLCRVLKQKACLGVRIRDAYSRHDRNKLKFIAETELPELIKDLAEFYQVFRSQWMKENKSFGFEVQSIRLGGLLQRLSDVRQTILEYAGEQRDMIEELEEPLLAYAYTSETQAVELEYNLWGNTVSPGVIG